MAASMELAKPNTSPSKMKIPRKRKADRLSGANDTSGHVSEKRPATESYSVAEFKVEMKDPNTIFQALEKFVKVAKAFSEESAYDIVDEYCQSSPECKEIFGIFETGRRKPAEIRSILESLESILLRIADDLGKHKNVGKFIVRRLLTSHISTIYFILNNANNAGQIKSALRTMTAMVLLGTETANEILLQFNFHHANIPPLLNRRDTKDPQDVRTCYIQFLMSFLVIGDNGIVRQLMEAKGILNMIFHDMRFDKMAVVHLVLQTMKDKIVENSAITKTIKVRVFNEKSLNELANVYQWLGPSAWLKERKNKKKPVAQEQEMVREDDTESSEDRKSVRELLHEFMISLCCSLKMGINFFDKTLGTSKNKNHLLTDMLLKMKSAATDDLMGQLVVEVLKVCPDQLVWYLPSLKESLRPRPSSVWQKTIRLLHKIFSSQPGVCPALTIQSEVTRATLMKMIMNTLLPPKDVWQQVIATLECENYSVKFEGLQMILIVLQRLTATLEFCSQPHGSYTSQELAEIRLFMIHSLRQLLPDMKSLIRCWNSAFNPSKPGSRTLNKLEGTVGEGFEEVSQTKYLVSLLQVLCAYQTTLPEVFREHTIDFGALLEGVRKEVVSKDQSHDDAGVKDVTMLQLYLLQLLAQSDIRQFSWTKESTSHKTTLYLLLEMTVTIAKEKQFSAAAAVLLIKLLLGTGAFNHLEAELQIWVEHLTKLEDSEASQVTEFLEKVTLKVLKDPYLYTEKVIDAGAVVSQVRTGDGAVESLSNAQFDDIMNMDIDLSDMTGVSGSHSVDVKTGRLPFSPLVPCSLEALSKTDIGTAVKSYFQNVLKDILWQQVEPEALCTLLVQYKDTQVVGPAIGVLIKKWLSMDVIQSPVSKKGKKAKDVLSLTELSIVDDSLLSKLDDQDLMDLPNSQVVPLATRILLSLRTVLMEEYGKNALKIYTDLLVKLDRKLLDSADQQSEETTDQILSFLDTSKFDIASVRETFYRLVLRHPSMKEWFLRTTEDVNESSRKSFALKRKSVSTVIAKIVSHMQKDSLLAVSSELEHYQHRLTEVATVNAGKDVMAASCFKNMTSILDAQQLLIVAESVLALPCDALVSENSLTDYGQACLALLREYLGSQSVNSGTTMLSYGAFKSVLVVASLVPDFDCIIEKSISMYPAIVTAVDEKYVNHCLQEGRESQVIILRLCLQLSPACRIWFCEWASKEKLRTDQLQQYSLLFQQFLASANLEDGFNQKVAKKVGKTVMKGLTSLLGHNQGFCHDLIKGLLKWSSQEFATNVFDKLLEIMEEQGNKELLKGLDILCSHLTENSDGQRNRIMVASLKYALVQASKKSSDKSHMSELLDALCDLLKGENSSLSELRDELKTLWPQVTKQLLRHQYQAPGTHFLLSTLAPIVYDGVVKVNPDLKTLHNMIISHSAFLDVMLNEEDTHASCKEKVAQLLLKLVTLDKSTCDVSHIAVMLGAYSATLKLSDQTILALMREYERNGCDMNQYKPYLWGAKAVEHHALRQDLSVALKKQPTMVQVLEGLDPDVMWHSVHHFPLTRSYENMDTSEDDVVACRTDVYDPLFLLPLFAHLLSPGNVTHCLKFVELHCLGYTIAALSSHDSLVRGAAYHVLHLFYQQLEGSRFSSKDLLMNFMKLIRNSIETPGVKLSPIVTIFLAKTAAILIDPQHGLYKAINSFLLIKPKLDVVNVPEFYKLFNSVELQYKFNRAWMLTLLKDGLRETPDYRIYQRRYIFKIILAFHDSPLSDVNSQTQVLEVLLQACKLKTVAFDLVKNHALLAWITALINEGPCSWALVTDILSSLWFTMLNKRDEAKPDLKLKRPCLPIHFTLEMLQVMVHLLMSMRQWMTGQHLCTYLHCFSSILKHLLATRLLALGDVEAHDAPKVVDTFVSFPFTLRLLLHWSKISKNAALEEQIHKVQVDYVKDSVNLADPEESETSKEDDSEGQPQDPVPLMIDTICIPSMQLSEFENAAEKGALLLTSNWLTSSLLEMPPDYTRWQQFVYWLRHMLRRKWVRLAYLCDPLRELRMNKLVHFYKLDNQELRMILNDIHVTLYQTCLKHKAPADLFNRLSGHFKSAMSDMSKELAPGNMQELLTELVMETKSGACDGHFKILLSRY